LERDYAKLFVGVLKIHEKFLRDILLARARVAVKYFRNLFRLKAETRSGIANSRGRTLDLGLRFEPTGLQGKNADLSTGPPSLHFLEFRST